MICKNIALYLLSKPWLIIHLVCFVLFTVQICFLAEEHIHPRDTNTVTEKKDISEIDFPVVFKICFRPGLDEIKLFKLGYAAIFYYFVGRSRFNSSLVGWAGHTKDGGIYSNVSGNFHLKTSSRQGYKFMLGQFFEEIDVLSPCLKIVKLEIIP